MHVRGWYVSHIQISSNPAKMYFFLLCWLIINQQYGSYASSDPVLMVSSCLHWFDKGEFCGSLGSHRILKQYSHNECSHIAMNACKCLHIKGWSLSLLTKSSKISLLFPLFYSSHFLSLIMRASDKNAASRYSREGESFPAFLLLSFYFITPAISLLFSLSLPHSAHLETL